MKILAHSTLPAKSIQEFLELARRKPNSLICGSGGWGAPAHYGCELARLRVSAQLLRVPYEGTRQFNRRLAWRVEA